MAPAEYFVDAELLALRLRGITRAVGDEGSEVSYPAYLVL